jgi:MFS family permease
MWSSMLLDTLSVLFASSIVLMPIFANDILHVGAKGLGFLYAAPAVGGLVMGIILARGIKIYRQGKILLFVVAIYSLATIVFGFSRSFIFSLVALVILGAANLVSVTIRSVIRQKLTPEHMRGRLYSFYSFFWILGDRVGDIEGGFVAQVVGAPAAVVIGGIGAVVVVGIMSIFNPELRNHVDIS